MKLNKGSALIVTMGFILLLSVISFGVYGILGYDANLENSLLNKQVIKIQLVNQLYDELNDGLDGDGYTPFADYYHFEKSANNYTYFMDATFDLFSNYTIVKEGFL
jgi:hypothetical protein